MSTHEQMFLSKCRNFLNSNISTRGVLQPPNFIFMPDALTIWAIGPDVPYVMFWNTGCGGVDMFL